MGGRRFYSLCLVLVLHDGLVHSLAPRVCSLTRVSQQHGGGYWSSVESAAAADSTTGSQLRHRRRTRNMISSSTSSLPPSQHNHHEDGDGVASFSSSASPPFRAVLSLLLATTVVLTGVVPGWEVQHPMMFSPGGVPAAAATTFNTEQAAIAETWVRSWSSSFLRT